MKNKIIVYLTIVGITIFGQVPANGADNDWVLPKSKITPGYRNVDVTQGNISKTICKVGWTLTIRPSTGYTNAWKKKHLETTYSDFASVWGTSFSLYEEDHLIPLQLGGSPDNPKNLWPQPYAGNNARRKDVVESVLKRMVCSGTIKLREAQKIIATNWVDAYNKYVTSKDKADKTAGE